MVAQRPLASTVIMTAMSKPPGHVHPVFTNCILIAKIFNVQYINILEHKSIYFYIITNQVVPKI